MSYAIAEFGEKQRMARVGPYKLIRGRDGNNELFHLVDDPAEQNNVAHSQGVAMRGVEVHLREAVHVRAKRERLTGMKSGVAHRGEDAELDDEMTEKLRALGYLNE